MNEYQVRHHQRLDAIASGLSQDPSLLVSLPDAVVAKTLGYLLAMACESQNMANIELGRETVTAVPAGWLSPRIHAVAERQLDLTNEWECRRLIELYALIDNQLAAEFAASCASSCDDAIAEAGNDYLFGLAETDSGNGHQQ